MISPLELAFQLPLSYKQKEFIDQSRNILKKIIEGKDERLILIVGPCSLHDEAATYEYADRLQRLAEEVSDKFFLIMRAYVEKPRTKNGWKGLLFDPTLDGQNDINKGLYITRKILLSLSERGIPAGCEILELLTEPYYSDLLTWGCIGARTSSSQPHRQIASYLPFPVGFKNSTDGQIEAAVHGIVAASHPHHFLGINNQGKISRIRSLGNSYCHLVLRGGDSGPNYQHQFFNRALDHCSEEGIHRKIMVDCSHGNSAKRPLSQIHVFRDTLSFYENGERSLLGVMLESHLEQGKQPLHFPLKYGISITDPCLGWEDTRSLILEGAYQSALSKMSV